jgi:hypothetical protein
MKIKLLILLMVLLIAGSGFCGLLEDQLKKAERGDADTQFNFGWMYASGPGVTQDYTRAVLLRIP